MTDHDVFEAVKTRILSMKDIQADKISMVVSFESLNFDSLDYVEIQVFILDLYRINISDELFIRHEISTLEQLVNYVVSEISQ